MTTEAARPEPSKVANVIEQFAAEIAEAVAAGRPPAALSNEVVRSTDDGAIAVAIWGMGPVGDSEKADLARLGVAIDSVISEPAQGAKPGVGLIEGRVPYDRIDDVAALGWVAAITPVEQGTTNTS